jgi:HK97 family phage major capsid protein
MADNQRHFERIVRRHARDLVWARNILARANPVYDDAWRMVMSGNGMLLTEEQRAAIAVGTGTQGGFLVPTHLDPTLIITNSGSSNIVRSISRVVTLGQENVWHGVSTAGVTASWDAELAEVSDDTPTFSNPSVSRLRRAGVRPGNPGRVGRHGRCGRRPGAVRRRA